MIDKRFKKKIDEGDKLFDREYREHVTRAGYLKLLNELKESNFILRSVKNGCSTLFDKDFMKVNYTNPILNSEGPRTHLDNYFNESKPKMYIRDLEKSIGNSVGSLS